MNKFCSIYSKHQGEKVECCEESGDLQMCWECWNEWESVEFCVNCKEEKIYDEGLGLCFYCYADFMIRFKRLKN